MARPTRAARRYAEAAFELATRDAAHDAWREGLAFAAAVIGDPRIARAASDPGQPFAERRKLIDRLLDKHVSASVANLVRLLAQRGRLDVLPLIAAEFQRLLNRDRGIVAATVTSAQTLDGGEEAAIRTRLQSMTGADVEITSVVDPELIGGLTVRVGDTLLDASVRGRLERLREQLVAGVR
jgi:F-type H+-transporting ATPase subunit delta